MTEAWMQVLAVIGSNVVIMLSFFGVTIALHLSTREDVRAIQAEMKDFHGKMERQDAEYKSHILHLHGYKEKK
jgi:hypothetical protein